MREKGFATIFGLCMILVMAIIVMGIHEAETNHSHEVLNFQLEQILQNTAESGIYSAGEYVKTHADFLPMSNGTSTTRKKIPITLAKSIKHGTRSISIEVEVWGERGKIYVNDEAAQIGVYLMAKASTPAKFFGGTNYRRAYAYILDAELERIHFMELP